MRKVLLPHAEWDRQEYDMLHVPGLLHFEFASKASALPFNGGLIFFAKPNLFA
jgi:hypothetical protein